MRNFKKMFQSWYFSWLPVFWGDQYDSDLSQTWNVYSVVVESRLFRDDLIETGSLVETQDVSVEKEQCHFYHNPLFISYHDKSYYTHVLGSKSRQTLAALEWDNWVAIYAKNDVGMAECPIEESFSCIYHNFEISLVYFCLSPAHFN